MRQRVYPRQIKVGDLDEAKAEKQLGALDAAIGTLVFVASVGAIIEKGDFAGGRHPDVLTVKHAGELVTYKRIENAEEKAADQG